MLGDPQDADRVVVTEAGDHRVQPHRTVGAGVLGDGQRLQVGRAEADLLGQLLRRRACSMVSGGPTLPPGSSQRPAVDTGRPPGRQDLAGAALRPPQAGNRHHDPCPGVRTCLVFLAALQDGGPGVEGRLWS